MVLVATARGAREVGGGGVEVLLVRARENGVVVLVVRAREGR